MANLYSLCVTTSDYHMPNGRDMYFVGIFDEENLKNGIKEFILRSERKIFPSDVSDEEVQEIVENEVDDEVLEDIIQDTDLILNIVGTAYMFFVQKTQCNIVNEVYMMFIK